MFATRGEPGGSEGEAGMIGEKVVFKDDTGLASVDCDPVWPDNAVTSRGGCLGV